MKRLFSKNKTMADPTPIYYGERTKTGRYGAIYRESKLTFNQIEAMRLHPIVKFCMQFLKMPLARVPINIQCDDPEMQAILTAIYEPILGDYLRQAAQCLDYGFWSAEVRYERRPVHYKLGDVDKVRNCIALKTFKGLKQKYTSVEEDEYGSFLGITYTESGSVKLPANEGKCLLVVNRFEQADRYGISELYAAKKAWDRQEQIENFSLRYYETKADPIPIVYYDDQNIYRKGETDLDTKDIAYEMGKCARQGRPIALPSKTDDKGNRLWEISYLTAADRSPLFRNAMEYHDVQMMRAMLVPERSLTQSEATGSYSMAEAHGSFLIERQEEVIDLLVQALNMYSLPRIIDYNFGSTSYEAKFVSGGLRETDKELTKQVIGAIMVSPNGLTEEQQEWIEKRTGIPLRVEADIVKKPDGIVEDDISAEAAQENMKAQANLRGSVGGVQGILAIQASVVAGVTDLEAAVALLVTIYGFEDSVARELLGKPKEAVEQPAAFCDCGKTHKLADKKYYRQLKPFERNIKFAAIDSYADNWLLRSSTSVNAIFYRQQEKYLNELNSIIENNTGVKSRLDAVRKLSLGYQSQYREMIYNALYELMDTSANYATQELGVKYTGLDTIAQGWARAQADNIWYSHDGAIRARANLVAITGISAELPDKQIMYDTKVEFENWNNNGVTIQQSLLFVLTNAINQGREVAVRIDFENAKSDENPIVACIRSELLDSNVCRYCRDILDLKIIDLDDPDYAEYFQVAPHHGCRGVNIYIRKSERIEYREDPKYKWKRPSEAQLTNWIKE